MAGNKTLELSIKIAGKVDKSLINAINAAQSNVSSLSTTLSKVGTVGLAAMGTLATGTVAALAKCTDAAQEFETQMSDVVKYVDGLADADGLISDKLASNGATYAQNYAKMSEAILDLSTEIPYTAEELTRLAAAAGQSGKAMDDIVKFDANGNVSGFLKDVAMMGTAWDISADQAGDWAAKWEVAFGKNHKEIMELADQINYLGANSATTAAEIAQVVNDTAGLGQIAGMDVAGTAALADAMLAMGVEGSKAATGISRIYTNMSLGASATKAQQEMWKSLGYTAEGVAKAMQAVDEGGNSLAPETLIGVFKAIKGLDADKQVAALKTLFGQWAIQGAAKLTGNLESYIWALEAVGDESKYNRSMEREFIIKSSNSEAIDMMMSNAFQALKIDVGTAFLPAKKEISVALIDFMNQLRSMPELGEIAQQLATLFSQGVSGAAEALEDAMPAIQKFLNYLVNNGPRVLSFLGKLAAAFTTMKFAPGIESLLRGAGGLVFGSKTGGSTHTGSGGIVGLMGSLFRGGQNAATAATAAIPNLLGTVGGILGTARIDAQLSGKSLLGTLFGGAGTLLGQTRLGGGVSNYLGGIRASLANLGNTGIGGALGEILSGISGATGLTGLVNGATGAVRSGAGWVAGKAGGLAQGAMGLAGRVAGSAPVQMIGGALRSVWEFAGAGLGALGNILGPMASSFGGLLSGALPVVGVISSIIAVVSILGDHLEDIRSIVGNVFGDAGLAVFDLFIGALSNVGDFITGLFADGGVAAAMAPLRDAITGIFGDDAGVAFDGLVQVLQSVMGVVGQVVTFANSTVKPIIQEIFGFITQTVIPVLLETFTAAAPAISGIIDTIGAAVVTVAQIIGTAIQVALPIIEGIATVFLNIASVAIPAVLDAFNWLADLVKMPVNAVISVVNGIIQGINAISFDVPDWVPFGLGGKHIGFDLAEIPLLAKGGFTNGPSIAGEAGTEAVISFQRSARASNIATWTKAGQMLGVSNKPARLETFDRSDGWPDWPDWPDWPAGNGGGPVTITYAPTIIIQGNASKEDVDAALRDDKARFDAWYEEKKRNERRARW